MKKIMTFAVAVFALVGSAFSEVTPITPKEAAARLKKEPKIVVIDIRTPEEFEQGHLNGAVNINMRSEDFEKKLGKLDRDTTYLMHCQSGGRSTASIPVWEKLGFKKVLHLDKGKKGWVDEGLPLVVPLKKEKEGNPTLPPIITGDK